MSLISDAGSLGNSEIARHSMWSSFSAASVAIDDGNRSRHSSGPSLTFTSIVGKLGSSLNMKLARTLSGIGMNFSENCELF